MFKMSIRIKNILFLSIFVTILLLIINIFSFYYIQDKFENYIRERTKIQLEQEIKFIKNSLDENNRLFVFLSTSNNLKDNLKSDPKDLNEIYKVKENIRNNLISLLPYNYQYKPNIYINNKLKLAQYYESLNLYDLSNLSYQVLSDKYIVNEEWFKYKNKTVFKIPNKEYIYIIQRIKDTDNKTILATVILSIKNAKLINSFHTDAITKNTTFILVNSSNEILLTNNKNYSKLDKYDTNLSNTNNIIINKYIDSDLKLIYITPMSDITKFSMEILTPVIFLEFALLLLGLIVTIIFAYYLSSKIIKLSKEINDINNEEDFSKIKLSKYSEIELKVIADSVKDLHSRNLNLLNKIKIEIEKNKIKELEFLQAQINPHFIFNAMDFVSFEALVNNQYILSDTVSMIADILRYAVINPNAKVLIDEEIDIVYKYLKIYNLRYENKIIFNYINNGITNLEIPKFIIQPLIENTIMHGWTDRKNSLNIEIEVIKTNNYYEINVKDSGKGADAKKLNSYLNSNIYIKTKNGLGIKNINERLNIVYGNNSRLEYSNDKDKKLIAHIKIYYT